MLFSLVDTAAHSSYDFYTEGFQYASELYTFELRAVIYNTVQSTHVSWQDIAVVKEKFN